jgi:hypothetical protein
MGVIGSSCSESFLKEELITQYSTDYFKTEAGLDDLTTGAYEKLKFKFNYEWGIRFYNMGIDEFTDANEPNPAFNHYSSDLNSAHGDLATVWDNYYAMIEATNILLTNIPLYYSDQSATYNTRLGEAYFLRGYAYFELVKQFGGVPLKLTPSVSVETYFTRADEESVYAQVLSDLGEAYRLLPESASQTGRLTKYVAAHFLAKTHLFRASELYSSWNSSYVSSDLDAVIRYGEEVAGAHPLCADYVELWDYKAPNGANEKVSEVILSAQFSDDQTTWGRYGNQMHLYYPSVYQDLGGTKRDISGDREFSRVGATEYTMQVFDRVNDSRFWKSFITTYGCNDTGSAPVWGESDMPYAPDGAELGVKRFVGGDIGIKYIVNSPGDSRYEAYENDRINNALKDGRICSTHTFVRYFKGESRSWNTFGGRGNHADQGKRSVALSKFRDGSRNSIASQFGTRDAIIARSSEDILMIAEAYIRKGESSYANALTWLNRLRERAGYAEGEDRSKHVDGGQSYKTNTYCTGKGGGYSAEGAIYCETNTYYESNDLEGEPLTDATKGAMRLSSLEDIYNSPADLPIYTELGLSSNADRMMCFLLNERTRELCGESVRWEDLARTRQLDIRWHKFNDGAVRGVGNFDPARHYLRPIPQNFLDGITNANGVTLSDAEKKSMQNPGY